MEVKTMLAAGGESNPRCPFSQKGECSFWDALFEAGDFRTE